MQSEQRPDLIADSQTSHATPILTSSAFVSIHKIIMESPNAVKLNGGEWAAEFLSEQAPGDGTAAESNYIFIKTYGPLKRAQKARLIQLVNTALLHTHYLIRIY
jgi:hypothetical protein